LAGSTTLKSTTKNDWDPVVDAVGMRRLPAPIDRSRGRIRRRDIEEDEERDDDDVDDDAERSSIDGCRSGGSSTTT